MKTQLYSIQGIIFQSGHTHGIGYKPGIGEAVTIQDAMIFAMYHGVVSEEETLCGHMHDKWGDSQVTNFKVSETELTFSKFYDRRPEIRYRFIKKTDDVWFGSWEGEDCGTGQSKCILTPIDESFFEVTKEM